MVRIKNRFVAAANLSATETKKEVKICLRFLRKRVRRVERKEERKETTQAVAKAIFR